MNIENGLETYVLKSARCAYKKKQRIRQISPADDPLLIAKGRRKCCNSLILLTFQAGYGILEVQRETPVEFGTKLDISIDER